MGPSAGSDPRGSVVLIVERDPHIRELERIYLEGAGYRVELAGDGPAALARVREMAPALVITDVLLPGMDGIALCRAIKEDRALESTSVLVFSAVYAPLRARRAGADAFLSKPVERQRLVSMVSGLLRRSAALRPQEGR